MVVFHRFAYPTGEIAVLAVELPRLVVHAIGQLKELEQVWRFEVELPLRTEKVEAPFRPQVAGGIFAQMPLSFGARGIRMKENGLWLATMPDDRIAGWKFVVFHGRALRH